MKIKTVAAIVVALTYILLIIARNQIQKSVEARKLFVKAECSWIHICVRFCCSDGDSNCSDDHLRVKFNTSLVSENNSEKNKSNFLISLGKPSCESFDIHEKFKFDLVSLRCECS